LETEKSRPTWAIIIAKNINKSIENNNMIFVEPGLKSFESGCGVAIYRAPHDSRKKYMAIKVSSTLTLR